LNCGNNKANVSRETNTRNKREQTMYSNKVATKQVQSSSPLATRDKQPITYPHNYKVKNNA